MIQAAGAAFMMGFVAVLAAASALVMMKFMLMFMAAAACAVIVVMIWMDMRIFVGAAGFGNLFRMFLSTAVCAFSVCGQPLSFSPFVCRICSSPIEMMAST